MLQSGLDVGVDFFMAMQIHQYFIAWIDFGVLLDYIMRFTIYSDDIHGYILQGFGD